MPARRCGVPYTGGCHNTLVRPVYADGCIYTDIYIVGDKRIPREACPKGGQHGCAAGMRTEKC